MQGSQRGGKVALGKVVGGEIGMAVLGMIAHSEVSEATLDETNKAMLIKIHARIGLGHLGGDVIQSDNSFENYCNSLSF